MLSALGASFSALMLCVVELPKDSFRATAVGERAFFRIESGVVVEADAGPCAGLCRLLANFRNFLGFGLLGGFHQTAGLPI